MLLTAETLKRSLIGPLSWKSYRRALRDKQVALVRVLSDPDLGRSRDDDSSSSNSSSVQPVIPSTRGKTIDNTDIERPTKVSEGPGNSREGSSVDTAEVAASDFWMVDVPSDDEEGDKLSLSLDFEGEDQGEGKEESGSLENVNSGKENEAGDCAATSSLDVDYMTVVAADGGFGAVSVSEEAERSLSSPSQGMRRGDFSPLTAVAEPITAASSHVTPFEDASEPLRLQYMSSYLDLAAREILSRATHSQRSSIDLQPPPPSTSTQGPRSTSLSLYLSRVICTPSLGSTGLSEHLAHSLLVPNQKYGVATPAASAATMPLPSPSSSSSSSSLPTSPSSMQLLSEIDREVAVQVTRSESKLRLRSDPPPPSSSSPRGRGRGRGRGGGSALSEAALYSLFGVQSGDLHGYPHSHPFGGALPRGRFATFSPPAHVLGTGNGNVGRNSNSTGGASSSPLLEGGGGETVEEGQRMREEMDKEKERLGPLVVMDAAGREEEFFHTDFAESITQKLRALKIPPLPPALGCLQHSDGRSYGIHMKSLDATTSTSNSQLPQQALPTTSTTSSTSSRRATSPLPLPLTGSSSSSKGCRQSLAAPAPLLPTLTLMSNIREHLAAVHRLAVSPDQSYFASASMDSTVKIWQLRGLDNAAFPRSSVTYTGHVEGVTDLCVIANSHSVVSASLDGQLHVWRIDLAGEKSYRRGRGPDGGR